MNNIYDVIIIGGGPAGLSAALYAARGRLKTLIIEKSTPGGTLVGITHLNNYPGFNQKDGSALAFIMYEQVTELNVPFEFDEVVEVYEKDELKVVKTLSNEFFAKNIIVATGTTYQNLKVANERKFIGKGISYCAVCDGKLFTNKKIVVLGDSSHTIKETLYLSNYASDIYLLTNDKIEKEDSFEKIKENIKVKIIKDAKITKLIGENTLSGVEILVDNEKKVLDVEGVFPLIGSLPSNSFLSTYPIFASNGYMIVDEHFQTSIKGIYGVGDVVDKELRQVVTACSDGAIAAQYIATHKN